MKKFVKGNEAVVIGALVAGCDAYFGYPITPASEIAHSAAEYFLKLGKIFIQAECETASINMIFGASASGLRVLTASSGPGISLKQEGVSFIAGCELPIVIADVMRAGPGLGNIGPEQGDYNQVVKGGGHGNYHVIVLAPNSVHEMYHMTIQAFELADKYRTPVYLLSDATLGQMMEPIDIVEMPTNTITKEWKLDATSETNNNLLTSIFLGYDDLETLIMRLENKYREIEEKEADAETYFTEDAELVLTGYGIVSRLLRTVVDTLRAEGHRVGMVRPKTLYPFPKKAYHEHVSNSARFLVVELSLGQFVHDVQLALPLRQVDLCYRVGGNVPAEQEIYHKALKLLEVGKTSG
ncbi:MAG: 3-methyl-2-oxobutanoate dehydrogenase subunit VorB [Planctomycetaceae bacterium]|jgi:pyruvate/2-oxoacid:ferredoxin oxidoreductase alpha subunit|nr:3-methyl-2-oxobutanoate dehydrogenase subunit VorB [Planctomycetaceae bacterium]